MASPRALRPLDGASMSSQSGLINLSPMPKGKKSFSAECVDGKIKGPASGRREGQYLR
jgi:hypothetical protein